MIHTFILLLLYGTTLHCMQIPPHEIEEIGKKIWQNECGSNYQKLLWWKNGEEFASLGLGHFIWFPAQYQGPFTQTFPALIAYFQKNGITLPSWLTPTTPCPWRTQQEFLAAHNCPEQKELFQLLSDTFSLQTQFIIERLCNALPRMLTTVTPLHAAHIQAQFYRVAHSPGGMYALVDYVHFKGEGTNKQEAYNGQGWGLLSVLAHMQGTSVGCEAIYAFASAAQKMLEQRVRNAPRERNEQQWLPGWLNRINTYKKACV